MTSHREEVGLIVTEVHNLQRDGRGSEMAHICVTSLMNYSLYPSKQDGYFLKALLMFCLRDPWSYSSP